jgi:Tfp pilus assembly protein PilO
MTSADLTSLLKKHPIGVGGVLLSIACGVLLYLRAGNIDEGQAELDTLSAEAAAMAANIRNSSNLPEQVTELQGHTKELDARLMKAGQLAVNLQYFYKLETENEVKLVDVRQISQAKNAKSIYSGIPFIVTVQGTYVQVMNFLNRLQNGRHFCHINTANFSKSPGTGGESLVNLALNLEILGQP